MPSGAAVLAGRGEERPVQAVVIVRRREGLRFVVKNGVDNAIRYSGDGGTVTVCVRDEDADALVEIHDDGPGLPPEVASSVFEPFRRGATSEQGAASCSPIGTARSVPTPP